MIAPSNGLASPSKKTLHATERDSPAAQAKRAAFLERLQTTSAERLVFVDEMGSHIAMIPSHARSLRGTRALGVARRNRGSNLTTIGALGLAGVVTSFAFLGATDGVAFEVFVREVLVPELRAGQVVVLDNLGAHHRAGVAEAVLPADFQAGAAHQAAAAHRETGEPVTGIMTGRCAS